MNDLKSACFPIRIKDFWYGSWSWKICDLHRFLAEQSVWNVAVCSGSTAQPFYRVWRLYLELDEDQNQCVSVRWWSAEWKNRRMSAAGLNRSRVSMCFGSTVESSYRLWRISDEQNPRVLFIFFHDRMVRWKGRIVGLERRIWRLAIPFCGCRRKFQGVSTISWRAG